MDIVIDEWIVHYIEEKDHYLVAFEVLSRIYDKCDNLLTLEKGPLMKKIHGMMKKISNWDDPDQIMVAKFMINNFLLNQKKFKRVDNEDVKELPKEVIEKISDKSDTFLFEAFYTSEDGIILTTDEKLKKETNLPIKIQILDDFLKNYDC